MKLCVLLFLSGLLMKRCISSPFARSDDVNPDTVLIQNLASRVNSLEAELVTQRQKVTLLENKLNQQAAFTVQMSDRGDVRVSAGHVIPFDHVTLNVGNGFSHTTHAFTAPYDGNYWFYVRLDETDFRSFEIRRNNHALNRCDNDGGLRSVTCGVVVTLKAGDLIMVNRGNRFGNGGHIDSGAESLFAGFKI